MAAHYLYLVFFSQNGDLFLHFHKLAPRPAESVQPMALGVDMKGGITLAQGMRHRDKNVHVSAIEKHVRSMKTRMTNFFCTLPFLCSYFFTTEMRSKYCFESRTKTTCSYFGRC